VSWGRIGALLGIAMLAGPAAGQLSLGAGIQSDYQFRGYSLSRNRPTANLHLGYDDVSGLFVDGTVIAMLGEDDGPQLLGGIAAVGYAQRLSGTLAFDVGLMRAQFTRYASAGRKEGYTELFAGLSGRWLAARLSWSPDYFRPGISTLYGRIEATARLADKWRLFGHVGALTRIGGMPAFPVARTQHDWRLGAGRSFGRLDLELSVSGGGPNRDYYDGDPHSRTALVGAARISF